MRKSIAVAGIMLVIHLYIGYYTNLGVHGSDIIFFIKKHPTFQIKFENLHTKSSDSVPWSELNMIEEKMIRDYCKYRLGIETWLDNAEELEACKAR